MADLKFFDVNCLFRRLVEFSMVEVVGAGGRGIALGGLYLCLGIIWGYKKEFAI